MTDNKKILPATAAEENTAWKGYTIDELKMARAKALLHREMGRLTLQNSLGNASSRVKQNGVRGLLFKNNVVSGLNKVDYLYLAFRAARLITRLIAKRRR